MEYNSLAISFSSPPTSKEFWIPETFMAVLILTLTTPPPHLLQVAFKAAIVNQP